MRISNIQNFAANAVNMMDKCCSPRKSVRNNTSQNSLERSPMMDTVSFGNFNGEYGSIADEYIFDKLVEVDVDSYDVLYRSTYFSLEPTEETIEDLSKNTYEMNLVSYGTFRPGASEQKVDDYDGTIKNLIRDFNNMHGYESGWEKKLSTAEDFIKAARLAHYVELRGYIQKDNNREEPLDIFNIHDRGYAT